MDTYSMYLLLSVWEQEIEWFPINIPAKTDLTHFITTQWTRLFPIAGCRVYYLLLLCFIDSPVVNANSVDPDHTPRSVGSDLDLHCFPIILLGSPD